MDTGTIIYAVFCALVILGLLIWTGVNWYNCSMAPKDAFIKAHQAYVDRLYEEARFEAERKKR